MDWDEQAQKDRISDVEEVLEPLGGSRTGLRGWAETTGASGKKIVAGSTVQRLLNPNETSPGTPATQASIDRLMKSYVIGKLDVDPSVMGPFSFATSTQQRSGQAKERAAKRTRKTDDENGVDSTNDEAGVEDPKENEVATQDEADVDDTRGRLAVWRALFEEPGEDDPAVRVGIRQELNRRFDRQSRAVQVSLFGLGMYVAIFVIAFVAAGLYWAVTEDGRRADEALLETQVSALERENQALTTQAEQAQTQLPGVGPSDDELAQTLEALEDQQVRADDLARDLMGWEQSYTNQNERWMLDTASRCSLAGDGHAAEAMEQLVEGIDGGNPELLDRAIEVLTAYDIGHTGRMSPTIFIENEQWKGDVDVAASTFSSNAAAMLSSFIELRSLVAQDRIVEARDRLADLRVLINNMDVTAPEPCRGWLTPFQN